ncbi:MAG: phage tail tape measure protein [Clostridium sp.]|nr:phage tail tape measure protein [Clostridium sp.]
MAGSIKLAPLMTEIKVDIDNFKSDMNKAASIGVSEANRISKQLSTTAKVGETLSKTGSSLTRGLTLPIVGAGAAVTKMAVDFEGNFAKVSTLLNSNVVDFGQYKNELLDASSESKVAVDEFSEAVYGSISAGVDQTKAITFTKDAMKLAKGGFTDGAKAVDVLTTAINGYGMQAEDATKISDLLITTQNLGKTTVDELASSMGTVIPVANSVNFGIEELSASYAQLTKNGIATAESGTYLKAMLSELGKSGSITDETLRELTGKGFAQLKAEGTATTDILNLLDEAAKKDGKTLKDMFGSVEAGSAALVLAKGSGKEYNEMLNGMATSAGATQEAFDKMDATPAEKLKGSLNELRNEGIRFGAAFVPVIEKAAGVLGKAASAFSGLSDEQQQSVIKWGMVLATAGPVLKVVGGGLSTFTKLSSVIGGASKALGAFGTAQSVAATAAGTASAAVGSAGLTGSMVGLLGVCAPVAAGAVAIGTGLYAVHESSQLAKRGVNEAKEEMSLMERVIATLSGTETHSREELEKMGYVHKEFSDEISPEFQEAVEKSTKKVQDFNVFLREIGFDGVISQEESDQFTQQVNDTCDEAIKAIQSKKDESQAALKELFVADDNVIDEGEQKVLDILSKSSDAQITEVNQLKEDILGIKQRAVDEGRALNEQEIADIEEKNARIRQIELESLGGTQDEIAYAKNEFNERIKTMDLESASKLMKEKAKIRDEEVVKIKASYNTEIDMLKAKLKDCTGEEKSALKEQISNLESDRDEKVKIQNDLYDSYLDIIEENNPKLLDGINKFNGKVLTNEDQHANDRISLYKETYSGLEKITESGVYNMLNKQTGMWESVSVLYDKGGKKITGVWSQSQQVSAGYTAQMGEDARKMGEEFTGSAYTIANAADLEIDAMGRIVDKNGIVVGSMDEVKGKTGEVRRGIVEINGTPYEIQVNKDGTIGALYEINDTADYASRERTIIMRAEYYESGLERLHSNGGSNYHRNFNGIDNVPYDGYRAILHKNERVLTAEENKSYSEGANIDYSKMEQCMRAAVKELALNIGEREIGRIIDNRLRERGVLA